MGLHSIGLRPTSLIIVLTSTKQEERKKRERKEDTAPVQWSQWFRSWQRPWKFAWHSGRGDPREQIGELVQLEGVPRTISNSVHSVPLTHPRSRASWITNDHRGAQRSPIRRFHSTIVNYPAGGTLCKSTLLRAAPEKPKWNEIPSASAIRSHGRLKMKRRLIRFISDFVVSSWSLHAAFSVYFCFGWNWK